MADNQQNKPVSPRKLAANRENALRSSGPKTAAGKQRSAQNAYEHGFFANRLFPTQTLIDEDWRRYCQIFDALLDHYHPVGYLEFSCIEKMAVESLRLSRLYGYEQKVLGWSAPFEERSIDRILRYATSVNRQLEKLTAQLEGLQARRLAELAECDSCEAEPDVISDEADESSPASEQSATTMQPVQTTEQPVAPDEAAPSNASSETTVSNPITETSETVKEGTADQSQTSNTSTIISQAAETNLKLGNERALSISQLMERWGDGGDEPIGSSRWIETKEDEELRKRLLTGRDIDEQSEHWVKSDKDRAWDYFILGE